MMFPPTFLDDIRERVPISQIVAMKVTWDRKKTQSTKGDFWACCPFHGEKSPSFHCEDTKGRYYCFGCQASGDHFRFLTELDGISFPEAVERVADMAGIPMPARDAQSEAREKAKASLHDVMALAAQFFVDQLQTAEGAHARSYLRGRGLTAATQAIFRMGYSPNSRNALKNFLVGKGVDPRQIEACGLVVHGDDIPVSYDRFRDRVMFPIEDTRGRVIAFGGRALSADVPAKYLNSPETDLFSKGRVLYNFSRARKAMGREGTLIAVEGYMDVIALAQAGIHNAIAPLGTALTEDQLEMVWRATPEPLLAFDGDKAGLKAAWRVADLSLAGLKPGRSLRFVLLPDGKDPDDIVSDGGPDAFHALVKSARPLADLLWMRETMAGTFDTPERRAALEVTLKGLTNRITDESVRYHYAQDMRDRVKAFFGTGQQQNKNNQNQRRGSQGKAGGAKGRFAVSDRLARSAMVRADTGSIPLHEAAILVTAVNHCRLIEHDVEAFEALHFSAPSAEQIKRIMLDVLCENAAPTRVKFLPAFDASGLAFEFQNCEMALKNSALWVTSEKAAFEDAEQAYQQLTSLNLRKHSLSIAMREVEQNLWHDETGEAMNDLKDLQAQFASLPSIEALIEDFGVLSGRPSSKG